MKRQAHAAVHKKHKQITRLQKILLRRDERTLADAEPLPERIAGSGSSVALSMQRTTIT
jgi:hypothetical protein